MLEKTYTIIKHMKLGVISVLIYYFSIESLE